MRPRATCAPSRCCASTASRPRSRCRCRTSTPTCWSRSAATTSGRRTRSSCAEAADVAAAITGDHHAARIRDAVAWDALPLADTGCADLAHDWFAYAVSMGERLPPTPSPTRARWTGWPAPIERAGRLDVFLGLGWAKQPRGVLERVL